MQGVKALRCLRAEAVQVSLIVTTHAQGLLAPSDQREVLLLRLSKGNQTTLQSAT